MELEDFIFPPLAECAMLKLPLGGRQKNETALTKAGEYLIYDFSTI